MRTALTFITIIVLFIITGYAQKVATMGEIAKPVDILVDADQIYIVSGAQVYIYSAKDYSFKKVFGQRGRRWRCRTAASRPTRTG